MRICLCCLVSVLGVALAQAPDFTGSYVLPAEDDAIGYQNPPEDDPVARLQRRLDSGEVSLQWEPAHGYLPSVLQHLGIPVSSQMLVFSKTSFQLHRIHPSAPRALYFNDDAYIGWVQGGEVIEVSSVDPRRGGMFYVLDQRRKPKPKFARIPECLQCHASPKTLGVPGHLIRSVYTEPDGQPILQAGSFLTDDRSPLGERWGGWYVSGTHGGMRHMGNALIADKDNAEKFDREPGANHTDLAKLLDPAPYLEPGSDIVSLLVLGHQARGHNLITRVSYETRMAISQQESMNQALKRPLNEWSDSTKRRVYGGAEILLRYFLFTEEAPLASPVRGTSHFAEDFEARGPRDGRNRSLRQFDLKTRVFRHPCSFLIYSEAFDSLPKPALGYIYRRLHEILTGKDQSRDYAKPTAEDKRAAFEILLETKKTLPGYWRASSASR